MKLSRIKATLTLLFLTLFLSQSAVFAQTGKKITISGDKITIKEALLSVEKQTEMSVAYNESALGAGKVISLKLKDASLENALGTILKGTGFTWKIEKGYIIISPEKKPAESRKISGTVIDETGLPIIGAGVVVPGGEGTVTDMDGKYVISARDGDVLEFSYLGYVPQSIPVSDKAVYDVKLQPDTELLDEVVVTALGIKRKTKALSYTITEVDSEELTKVKDMNFVNSLTGKVAGLQINSSSSGVGGPTKVVMRGSKSISKSNNVLYVVDGVPLYNPNGGEKTDQGFYTSASSSSGEGIADFNPEDIASISVLTGPSAAALYGSNAANGAILITTKKGSAGKPKITLSHNTDFSNPFVLPRFQNTYGNKAGEFSSWGDKLETPSSYEPKKFFRTGYSTNTSLSISLGTERNQTFASLSSSVAEGIIPNNKYSRHNFTVNNTSNFCKDKLILDLGFSYVIQKDQNRVAQGQYFNPIVPVYLFPRGENFEKYRMYERYDEERQIKTQFWPYGEMSMAMQNPYWTVNRNLFNNDKDRFMVNASLKYKILDWFDITGRVRVDNAYNRWTKKLYASTDAKYANSKGYYGDRKEVNKQIYADVLANINKRFGDFDINANIGASVQDLRYDEVGAQGQLSMIPNFFALNNVNLSANNSKILQDGWKEQTQSVFASVELGWKSMLYLTATARNDWASALVNTRSTSFFYPSVGLSWVLTETFNMPDWFSFWKLRASYSSVGNAPSRYLTIPTFGYDSQGNFQTATHMPVPELFPEKTRSYEVGTNMKFLDGMLGLDVTYYKSNTFNQTFEAKASASSGYSTFYIQAGDIGNWGIEAMLSYDNNWGDFGWNSNLTFSLNRNRINELVNNYTDPSGEIVNIPSLEVSKFGDYRMILEEGGSMGDIYTTTRLKEDSAGNIFVNSNTGSLVRDYYLQKVGNVNPDFNLGFRNGFSYKGVNLSFLITARVGGEVMSATQAILDSYGVTETTAIARDNGGVRVNNGMYDAKAFYEFVGSGDTGMLSRYVYSATNVRLQELTLGYTFPKEWFKEKLGLTLSFVGRNLWMIYNKAPFDPEAVAFTGTYFQGLDYFMQPSQRNLGFSVKLQF